MGKLIENKKAGFNYEFLEKMTSGLELSGQEVKSLRKKQGSLDGSYVVLKDGGAFLVGSYIPPYQPNNILYSYDPKRDRRILLTKKEIDRLLGLQKQKGLTIVPISIYTKGRWIKLDIAVARGKKKFDKREAIKKRDSQRDVLRELKDR